MNAIWKRGLPIAVVALLPGPCGDVVSGQQVPTFKAAAEALILSAVVVDRNGRPITDLRPGDFDVTVAGKPATVRTAEFVGISSRATERVESSRLPSGTRDQRARRSVLLVFDDLSFASEEAIEWRGVLPRLLAQLEPDDLVGLTTTSGIGPTIVPTEQHTVVADALRQVDGRSNAAQSTVFIGLDEALEIDRGVPPQTLARVMARECRAGVPSCENLVEAQAKRQAAEARRSFLGLTDALSLAVSTMGQLGAPRVLILCSKGVADQADPDQRRKVFEEIQSVAALGGVQLYALALSGDESETRDLTHERAQARRLSNRAYFRGLQAAASAGGGEAFNVVGQPDRFFERIVAETSGFYRLGVELGETAHGAGTVATNVVVRRRGVTVRSVGRTRTADLTIGSKPTTATDAFSHGVPAAQFPLLVGSATRRAAGGAIEVIVEVRPALQYVPVQVVFGLIDGRQQLVTGGQRTLKEATQEPMSLHFPLQAPPGSYRLRVSAMDARGRVSLTEQEVHGLGHAQDVEWSDLLFQARVGDQLTPRFQFTTLTPGVTGLASVEVYAESPSVLQRVTVQFSRSVLGGSGPQSLSERLPLTAIELGGVASVEVPPLAPGDSGATIRATVFLNGHELGHVERELQVQSANSSRSDKF